MILDADACCVNNDSILFSRYFAFGYKTDSFHSEKQDRKIVISK